MVAKNDKLLQSWVNKTLRGKLDAARFGIKCDVAEGAMLLRHEAIHPLTHHPYSFTLGALDCLDPKKKMLCFYTEGLEENFYAITPGRICHLPDGNYLFKNLLGEMLSKRVDILPPIFSPFGLMMALYEENMRGDLSERGREMAMAISDALRIP